MCLLVAACVVAAAGCGGSAADTVTVTTPAPSQPATSTAPTVTPTKEFVRYLARIRVIQRRYKSIRRQALAALDIVNASGPDQTWMTAGRRLRRLQRQIDQLGAETTNITPPASLALANRKLVSSFAGFSQYYDGVASSLLSRNVQGFVSAAENNSIINRLLAQRTAWRVAVTAAALRLHVPVPAWVRIVGTT